MMRKRNLVIYTDYRENYGAHTWDGEGECPQYWKCKGGNTYVYEDVTPEQEIKIRKNGIPTLKNLIEYDDDYSTNYVNGFFIVDSVTSIIDDYEIDYVHWLKYDHTKKDWFYTIRRNGRVSPPLPLKMKYN